MNLTKCTNGHFYDPEKYSSCPHCGNGLPASEMKITSSMADAQKLDNTVSVIDMDELSDRTHSLQNQSAEHTVPLDSAKNGSEKNVSDNVVGFVPSDYNQVNPNYDEQKTVSYYDKAIGSEPVVGWLVCTQGNNFGQDFKLKSGGNFIGRGREMDISLSGDPSVSRKKHAIVVYEPKNNMFLMQPGESRELSYLNGQVVLSTTQLSAYDVIQVGSTKLMFIPFCSDKFKWDDVQNESEDNK